MGIQNHLSKCGRPHRPVTLRRDVGRHTCLNSISAREQVKGCSQALGSLESRLCRLDCRRHPLMRAAGGQSTESLYSVRLIRQSNLRACVTERVVREKADCHSRCKGVLRTVSVVATVTRKPQAASAAYGLLVCSPVPTQP